MDSSKSTSENGFLFTFVSSYIHRTSFNIAFTYFGLCQRKHQMNLVFQRN